MADKIVHLRLDVTKIDKKWLYEGKKGTYLDITYFHNEEQDDFGNNGMVVQSVPSDVYKADKSAKGAILGNGKVFQKSGDARESSPGYTGDSKPAQAAPASAADDLPF